MMQLKIIVKLEVSNALFKFKSIMLWITNTNGGLFVCLMVFNATFNNISVISWWLVLLMEETGGPRENHRPVASH